VRPLARIRARASSPRHTSPSAGRLRITIPNPTPKGVAHREPFIRFNELVNALEALQDIPEDVRDALGAGSVNTHEGGLDFAARVRQYAHGGPLTLYAIGEALAEQLGSSEWDSSVGPAGTGLISREAIARQRHADPAFDKVMDHLVGSGDVVRPADSPLARVVKEAHSVEFLRLCSRSSRRPEMSMPGLRSVIDEIRAIEDRPFDGVHLFQAQHAFDADESQVRGLLELGLDPAQLWYFPKTGARALALDRLRRAGVQVYDNAYDLRRFRRQAEPHLVKFLDRAFGLEGVPLEEQVRRLRAHPSQSPGRPKPRVLLVDEGFKVGQVLVALQLSDDEGVREKYVLISGACSMVAHTEGDIIKGAKAMADAQTKAAALGVHAPVLPRTVNMAQSAAKKLEGFWIGHDVWLATNQLLNSLGDPETIARRPKEALVIGYGVVAAKAQPQLRAGYDVWVWDIDPRALLRAYQDHEKTPGSGTGKLHVPVDRAVLERVIAGGGSRHGEQFVQALSAAKNEWFAHGHLVVGNTGALVGSLSAGDFDLLPDGALLASGASGDYEFGTQAARGENPHLTRVLQDGGGRVDFPLGGAGSGSTSVVIASDDQSYFDHEVYETRGGTADAKRLMILRGGYVVNRLYGSPPAFIDVTKAMMVRSMYEAMQPHVDVPPGSGLWLVDPDREAQQRLIDVVNRNLAAQGLGSLEEPNSAAIPVDWHRPAVPPSPHPDRSVESEGNTSERFVQCGLEACRAYNISAQSFALICDPENWPTNAQDVQLLERAMRAEATKSAATPQPPRTVAHTLYALFARNTTPSSRGLDAEVNQARKQLGIDDGLWASLVGLRDTHGMLPAAYGALPRAPAVGPSDAEQRGRASMQDCISVVTIGAPTQAQIKGDPNRRGNIVSVISQFDGALSRRV
jgi:hypothetical protein